MGYSSSFWPGSSMLALFLRVVGEVRSEWPSGRPGSTGVCCARGDAGSTPVGGGAEVAAARMKAGVLDDVIKYSS